MTASIYSKAAFIKLALDAGVLKFGTFQLKSGRISPYFFNAGLFYQGKTLKQLGEFYAQALYAKNSNNTCLFGPAYKGISLATATSLALYDLGIESTVTFNRKEVKTHGEGGQLMGGPLTEEVVMVDDVITAGTAFREAKTLIHQHGGKLSSVIIALDRCERGQGSLSTLDEIRAEGINVMSIITLFDLIDYLEEQNQYDELALLKEYQLRYGTEKK